jgi:PKD repeat protein
MRIATAPSTRGIALALLLVTLAPSLASDAALPDSGRGEARAYNVSAPSTPQKLIFIHHSTGGYWLADPASQELGGDLGRALRDSNYFVSATNYDWGPDSIGSNTDIGHWWEWFRGSNSATYLAALYAETGQNIGDFGSWPRLASDPGGPNTIVMFKSCFPNSNLGGSPSDPIPPIGSNPLRGQDYSSDAMTVGNAKGIYIDILNYFQAHPEKLFIVIVQPPLMQADTNPTRAANARALAEWLVNDWLDTYTHHNVFVFDFFNVLTSNGGNPDTNDLGAAGGNHHRYRNGAIEHVHPVNNNYSSYPSGDSHPSRAGNEKATGEYIQLLNLAYHCWKGTGDCPGGAPTCSLSCSATVPATGTAGAAVSFQSTATATNCSGGITHAWAFGDGATSASEDPTHTYAAAGTYNWSYSATVTGTTPCTHSGSITVSAAPVCTLTCSATVPATGTTGVAVAFQSTATATNCAGGLTYAWAFGDGATSALEDPTYTYAAAGTYNWTYTATVSGTSPCTHSGSITITATPVCTLTCSTTVPATGTTGVAVAFQSTATATNCSGGITHAWAFGDGATSASEDPTHTYAAAGTYNWTYTATVSGAAPCTQTGSITVTDVPSCTISCLSSAAPTSGAAPLEVTFTGGATTSNCTGATTYAWNFGDGATSTEQSPTHTYSTAGTYTWSFSATADGVTCTQSGAITVTGGATCAITCDTTVPATGAAGASVTLQSTATATNCTAALHYEWSFGDGTPNAYSATVVHTYASAGTYSWILWVTADDQTCTRTGNITVTSSGTYQTYHVRTDGGDASQCTGLADAAYPGSGTGQPCAWNHPFQALPPGGPARMAGGDTLVIHAGSYRMGYGAPGAEPCAQEYPWDCYMVSVPSGPDAAHPTRIVGEMTARGCTAKPELWGAERPYHIVDLHGSSHVEVACLDITDHSSCIEDHNQGNLPCSGCTVRCNRDSYPYGDWAMSGISGRDSDDVRITDVDVHGLANMGIHAGRISNWTLDRVKILGNGSAGWHGDLWDPSSNSGTILFRNVEIAFNGCSEAYPAKTITMDTCWAQEAGGYGDGLGTATTGGHWVFEDCKIHHNTSDGLDLLYMDPTASVEVRRLWAEGNAGNQVKTSGAATVENSVLIGNCAYFEGQPLMQEGDHCRAAGNTLSLDVHRGSQVSLVNNTVTGQGDCLLIVGCNDSYPDDADPDCNGTERVVVHNTLFYGNLEWRQSDEWTCLAWYDDALIPANPLSLDYNLVYRTKDDPCPGTHDICGLDPLLQDASLAHFNGHLTAGSPAVNMGTATGAPAADYDGILRTSPPDIGAYELASGCSLSCTASATPSAGNAPLQVVFAATASAFGCAGSPTFAWTFGDGETSVQQNPTHTYLVVGAFSWTLTVTADGMTCTQTGTVTVTTCQMTCTAGANPTTGNEPLNVQFSATAGLVNCGSVEATFHWTFGDGATSDQQNPTHTFLAAGTYNWTMTATLGDLTCTKTGTVVVLPAGTSLPGDCDGDGSVSIGEVQKAINMFLGTLAPGCGVDCNQDGSVSIGEVQKVINAFLGIATSC